MSSQNDVEARNFCATKSQELIESAYVPTNPNADKEGVRMAIFNSCYVGYNNGLSKTAPKDAAAICDGSVLTDAEQRTQTDFPQICKDAYESASGVSLANTQTTAANSTCANAGSERFLTMPTWYRGLLDEECKPSPAAVGGDNGKFILTIVFNIVEIMLHIVGYISGMFIIVGGYRFMTSAGSIDGNAKARKTIINALIGLVVSIMSVGIVNLIVARI